MPDWINTQTLTTYVLNAGTKLLGAIVLWIIGGIVINLIIKASGYGEKSSSDALILIFDDKNSNPVR